MHLYTKPHKHILHTRTLTHKSFHVRMFSPIEAFTHRKLWHASFTHTDAFTPGNLQMHMRLHAGTFTHRCPYTQELPATAFTNNFYTKAFACKSFCASSFYTEAVDHRCFHTQTPLRTQVVLHTECFHHHLHKKALKKNLLSCSKVQKFIFAIFQFASTSLGQVI